MVGRTPLPVGRGWADILSNEGRVGMTIEGLKVKNVSPKSIATIPKAERT